MELLIITGLIIIAWFMAAESGRERMNAAAAVDDRPGAYRALGCNVLLSLAVLAILLFTIFGLAGTPLPH